MIVKTKLTSFVSGLSYYSFTDNKYSEKGYTNKIIEEENLMQSKKNSFIESLTNVTIGYGVAIASQLIIFPIFDIHITLSENFLIGLWFTIISIIRSYIIRRCFNRRVFSLNKIDNRVSL